MRLSLLSAILCLSACQSDAPTDGAPSRSAATSLPDTAMVREATVDGTARLVTDLRRASPSVAIQTIDWWEMRLDTTAIDGDLADTLSVLRRNLETLRGQLQSSPLDGVAIGHSLSDLGRQTMALSSLDPSLGSLGQSLEAAGARLAPPDTTETAGVQ